MSERHCVNCRHNIRKKDEKGNIYCECEIDGSYISYVQSFEGWCKHWAKEREEETIKKDTYPCYTCTLDCDTTCEIYERWLQKTEESEEEE